MLLLLHADRIGSRTQPFRAMPQKLATLLRKNASDPGSTLSSYGPDGYSKPIPLSAASHHQFRHMCDPDKIGLGSPSPPSSSLLLQAPLSHQASSPYVPVLQISSTQRIIQYFCQQFSGTKAAQRQWPSGLECQSLDGSIMRVGSNPT